MKTGVFFPHADPRSASLIPCPSAEVSVLKDYFGMCITLAVSQTPEEIFNFQDLDSEHFDSVSEQISKSVF